MKYSIFLLALFSFLFTACGRQEMIMESELTGIWKLNGFQSSTYKMEFTADGYVYWWNYNDIFGRVEEFEREYDPNRNRVRLFRPGGNSIRHQFNIYRQRNGRLYFTVSIDSNGPNGEPLNESATYYQMN